LQTHAYITEEEVGGKGGDTCLLPAIKGAVGSISRQGPDQWMGGWFLNNPSRFTSGQPHFVTAFDIEMKIESR